MAPLGNQEYSNTVLYKSKLIVKEEASEATIMIVKDFPLRIGRNLSTQFLGAHRGSS